MRCGVLVCPVNGWLTWLQVTVDDPEAAIAVENQVAKYLWCSLVSG